MNREVCISHRQSFDFEIIETSALEKNSGSNAASASASLLKENGLAWHTEHTLENEQAMFVLALDQSQYINAITLGFDKSETQSWPSHFRFEMSDDGETWSSLLKEENYNGDVKGYYTWHIPLIKTKYLKLIVLRHYEKQGQYYSIIKSLGLGIHGIENIKASSELDRLWTKENIVDNRPDYGWSSKIHSQKEVEHLEIDLGSINHVNKIAIKSKDAINHFFPRSFYFEYSKDGQLWHTMHDEQNFEAQTNQWYSWTFLPTNMRYFRLVITEGAQNEEGNFISQIIEIKIFGVGLNFDHSHPHEGITPYATTLHAGLIRLAKDGEASKNIAVQASDSRLKYASSHRPGIVRLAQNGEVTENAVVQADDKRLNDATETYKGIVQLAKNGENRANLAVQGNDKRLQEATVESSGIMKLCPPGEALSARAVQGNDPRLRNASESFPGIVQLAKDGDEKPQMAVQGNDKRLKKATTEQPGILSFAKDGEVHAEKAVQANDKRLREATENYKGIVRLAKDGEQSAGVAVQGNDKRLHPASETNAGIIALAAHGKSQPGTVVQGDDPRLDDAREPKPHEHEYAPKQHNFNEHTGKIWLRGQGRTSLSDTNPPQKESPLIGAEIDHDSDTKEKDGSHSIAMAGVVMESKNGIKDIGLLGHSPYIGVRGQALGQNIKNASGVSGHGRDCPGGRFMSRNDFALVAGGDTLEDGSQSSGKAIFAQGQSKFQGQVRLISEPEEDAVISYFFAADFHSPLENGDIVCIHDKKDHHVIKSEKKYDTSVLGVVASQSSLAMQKNAHNTDPSARGVFVAMQGVVTMKVDPSFGEIKPGDLLTTSKTAGHAMKAKIERFDQIGSIIGKALQGAKGKTTIIKVALGKH